MQITSIEYEQVSKTYSVVHLGKFYLSINTNEDGFVISLHTEGDDSVLEEIARDWS